ncbi:acyl transferase/acyl hydrolase/lysophospholipase [Stachybotrys elegans]|uniref:Acyl transferase/acyl hydrolase/lysophospholipase n=1 Tax=Stachybotrys elegans TaxID=80388 RepID=A0A8K0WKF8_9HYPO|nr:acyl transferase/acyl hydrolase/lysophospholipase [Stachybotrys elegans]
MAEIKEPVENIDVALTNLPFAFVFTGQVAQYPKMGRVLLQANNGFLHVIQKLGSILQSLPASVAPTWTLEQTILDTLDVSQVNHLTHVVGHSSREIAAAYAAGLINAKEAIFAAYIHAADIMIEKLKEKRLLAKKLVTGGCAYYSHLIAEHAEIEETRLIEERRQNLLCRPALLSTGAITWRSLQFSNAPTKLVESSKFHLIELGPHPALMSPIQQLLDAEISISKLTGGHYKHGHSLDWARVNQLPKDSQAVCQSILSYPQDYSTSTLWSEPCPRVELRNPRLRKQPKTFDARLLHEQAANQIAPLTGDAHYVIITRKSVAGLRAAGFSCIPLGKQILLAVREIQQKLMDAHNVLIVVKSSLGLADALQKSLQKSSDAAQVKITKIANLASEIIKPETIVISRLEIESEFLAAISLEENPIEKIPLSSTAGFVDVEMKAVSLNAKDIYITSGQIKTLNTTSALEFSGIVTAVGASVDHVQVGDFIGLR